MSEGADKHQLNGCAEPLLHVKLTSPNELSSKLSAHILCPVPRLFNIPVTVHSSNLPDRDSTGSSAFRLNIEGYLQKPDSISVREYIDWPNVYDVTNQVGSPPPTTCIMS